MDVKAFDASSLIDQYGSMAFQARNLARAAKIYDMMLRDPGCSVILCIAGSLVSAGLKKVFYDLIDNNMVDAIVSNGANIVDQDFFEALGFSHYQGSPAADDELLVKEGLDRIYDTYIVENELRVCDSTIAKIADSLERRPYSSREFVSYMGRYLKDNNKGPDSIVRRAYEKGVPVFVPAFSDCSAGFGLVYHQWHNPQNSVSIDSARDFLELTKVKIGSRETGLLMLGGGVPKNFAQDVVVSADFLGQDAGMHKYAVQVTVADERDGALSGSTLREAHSWGKVDTSYEQMVYSEATVAFPLIASYAYHRGGWKDRCEKRFNDLF